MSILFRKTGGADFPDHIKALISGAPKSGKTSWLGTVPNIVIADTEPHANNLQSIAHLNVPYVSVPNTGELQRLLFVLRDDAMRAKAAEQLGIPKIEAVAIDTLDTLQGIMKRERLAEQRRSQFQRDDWGWLKEEMTSIVRNFTALPMHVFFTVHLKSVEVGGQDDGRTVMAPGLEGAISESIAGMVGYSLLAFRTQEIRPDGSKYTKYWLRAEGDQTYTFLGNRAAGRLPDVIEPSFKAVYSAALAGRAAIKEAAQPAELEATPPVQVVDADAAPAAPAPVAEKVEVAQPVAEPAPAPVEPIAQDAPAPATPPAPPSDSEEPINAAGLTHVKRVYDSLGLTFPEDRIRELNLGQARELVRMWKAVQQDAVEGKLQDPNAEMKSHLEALDLLGAEAPKSVAVEPNPNGTIEQVLAYVGDSLERAQEVYDAESQKGKPRATLLNALESKGAKPATPTPAAEASQATEAEPTATTPEPAPAEQPADPELNRAEQLVHEVLGGVPVTEDGAVPPCEECGDKVDDEDIAMLSKSRFHRWLCVKDYVAETRKSKS